MNTKPFECLIKTNEGAKPQMQGFRALLRKQSMEGIQTLNQRFTFIFTSALWARRSISYNAAFRASVKAQDQKRELGSNWKEKKVFECILQFL